MGVHQAANHEIMTIEHKFCPLWIGIARDAKWERLSCGGITQASLFGWYLGLRATQTSWKSVVCNFDDGDGDNVVQKRPSLPHSIVTFPSSVLQSS